MKNEHKIHEQIKSVWQTQTESETHADKHKQTLQLFILHLF